MCVCVSVLNSSCVSAQDPDVKNLFDRITELRAQLALQEDEVADATRSDDEFYEPDGQPVPEMVENADVELGDATEDQDEFQDVELCDAMEDHDGGKDEELVDASAMEDHDSCEDAAAMEDHDSGEDTAAMEDHDSGKDAELADAVEKVHGDGRDVVMDRHRSRLSTTSFQAPSEVGVFDGMITEEVMGDLPEGMDDEQAMELSMILQQIHDLELGFVSENVIVC